MTGKGRQRPRPSPASSPAIVEPLRHLAVPIDSLEHDPQNARVHGEKNMRAITSSLQAFGQTKPVVVQRSRMRIVAGNGLVMAARSLGWTEVAATVLDLDDVTATKLAIADNRSGELSTWDDEVLARLLQGLDEESRRLVSFEASEVAKLLGDLSLVDEAVPAVPSKPITQPGDVIQLGRHRLLCGDSTIAENVEAVLDGAVVKLVCTDPPYCSGGFQETGKSQGSVGTTAAHKHVANDRLSTRGFQRLLREAFSQFDAEFLFAFTDWRMWMPLHDIVEASGFGVRQMIVWDKETPGLGRGWRGQHELVLWGARSTAPWPKGQAGTANLIRCKRTGNEHHTTEKPLEVVRHLLEAVPFCDVVADPFAGSGTTLICCEALGRTCFAFELDPGYCDVIVARWEQMTKQTAQRPEPKRKRR